MTATTASEVAAPPGLAPAAGNPRFPLFDSLRGVAALFIVFFHVASVTAFDVPVVQDVVAIIGPRSLTLFFVISGFLLYRPFVAARAASRPPPRTLRYLRRRAFRIVPAYWVALTVLAVFPGILGVFTGDWWRYYFFLQLYSQDTVGRGIPVAWSLCVEVTFYLSLPLWALFLRRLEFGTGPRAWLRAELGALALVGLAGAAVQIAAARNVVSDILGATLLGQCVWIGLGMALAVLSVAADHSEREPRIVRFVADHPGLCWLGAGLALGGLAALSQSGGIVGILVALQDGQPLWETVTGIVLAVVMCALFVLPAVFGDGRGGFPRRFLAAAPVAWLGLVSYGLFLWHVPVLLLLALPADATYLDTGLDLAAAIGFATTPVLFAVTLAATSALAAASYYLVELPFLRRK